MQASSLRPGPGSLSPALVVELQLYTVAVRVADVEGRAFAPGSRYAVGSLLDLDALTLQVRRQLVPLRALDTQRQVVVASGRPALEVGIGGEVQDEVLRYPERDERTLPPTILLEAEGCEAQHVPVEAERGLEVPHPPVGVIRAGYLHASILQKMEESSPTTSSPPLRRLRRRRTRRRPDGR